MLVFLIIISITVFLFGLVQWARGGATLWTLFSLKKKEKSIYKSDVRARFQIELDLA